MSSDEVTESADVGEDTVGQNGRRGGRVSTWVSEHTPLAIALTGLLSAVFALLAANPAVLVALKIVDAKPASLSKVTAQIETHPKIGAASSADLSGTFEGDLQGRSLWGFIKNIDDGTMWPSYNPCSINIAEKEWHCHVTPLPGTSEFQIHLVDSRAVNEILQWVMKEKSDEAPALTGKMEGSEKLDGSTIVR
ncbi:hypothetical protein [Streptomyces sp. NPDC097619]|uniref:hypothetical protein n=1 Tax=Streptomyces sp. NPDC097619 TaxID=3157228 RepID=UPI003320FEB4